MSEDEHELYEPEIIEEIDEKVPESVPLEKPKRPRTEKQLASLEKARTTRLEKLAEKRHQERKQLKPKKTQKKPKKPKVVYYSESSSSSEEEIVYKKKKPMRSVKPTYSDEEEVQEPRLSYYWGVGTPLRRFLFARNESVLNVLS